MTRANRAHSQSSDAALMGRVFGLPEGRLRSIAEAGMVRQLFSRRGDHALQGLDDDLAERFLALRELLSRLHRRLLSEPPSIRRPDQVAAYVGLRHLDIDREVCGALFLDSAHRLVADEVLYVGKLRSVAAEPLGFLRRALALATPAFVAFHTHPSGLSLPSDEDADFTRRLRDAARIVDVRLVDHVIVSGRGDFCSMRRTSPELFD